MYLQQIIIRSLSGFLFLAPGMLLYFWVQSKQGRKQSPLHEAGCLLFGYYLMGMLTVTGIRQFKAFSPRLFLVPFLDMIVGPEQTILNVVLFVPLGFFLPLLYQGSRSLRRTAGTGFLFSLSIELIQMFDMGTTDINDLITNTAGCCLGYGLYLLASKATRTDFLQHFQSTGTRELREIWFFWAYAFAVMVTVQPVFLDRVLHLSW